LTRYGTWREVNVYYLSVKGSVKLGVNFSVMFHSTKGNDFCSETGSSTASLLCGSTVGYPSASLASCLLPAATRVPEQKQITADVLNISAIFNRIYGIRISIYRILPYNSTPINFMIVSDIFCVFRPMPYTSRFLNIPSLCLCIASLSDVKH